MLHDMVLKQEVQQSPVPHPPALVSDPALEAIMRQVPGGFVCHTCSV